MMVVGVLFSCKKDGSSSPTTNSTILNGTEKQLAGKWFLKIKSDTIRLNGVIDNQTTLYNTFLGEHYVELQTTKGRFAQVGGDNAFNAVDGGTKMGPPALGPVIGVTLQKGYWYFNEAGNWFVWGGVNLKLVSVNKSYLIIKYDSLASGKTWTITWEYYQK